MIMVRLFVATDPRGRGNSALSEPSFSHPWHQCTVLVDEYKTCFAVMGACPNSEKGRRSVLSLMQPYSILYYYYLLFFQHTLKINVWKN
jgi:hypothetical protein